MDLMKDERGQFTDIILLFFIIVFGLVVFVFLGGLGANLTSAFYAANQPNIVATQANIAQIQDTNIQADLNNFVAAYNTQQSTGISIFLTICTYGAVFTVVLLVIVLFLIRRQDVQVGRIG